VSPEEGFGVWFATHPRGGGEEWGGTLGRPTQGDEEGPNAKKASFCGLKHWWSAAVVEKLSRSGIHRVTKLVQSSKRLTLGQKKLKFLTVMGRRKRVEEIGKKGRVDDKVPRERRGSRTRRGGVKVSRLGQKEVDRGIQSTDQKSPSQDLHDDRYVKRRI